MSTPTPADVSKMVHSQKPSSTTEPGSSTSASTGKPAPTAEASKRPFVRKPHLTQRLTDNPILKDLSAQLHTKRK